MRVSSGWVATVLGLLVAASPRAALGEGEGSAPVADDPTLIALAVALACAEPLAPPDGPAPGGSEIELVTTVRARSLRLDAIPRLDGVLRGASGRRTSWRAERVNLPARPEPGVVYRDVEVRLTLATDVDGLAAMLREAKQAARGLRLEEGEAPPVDVAAAPIVAPELVGAPNGEARPTPIPIPNSTPTPSTTPTPTATSTGTSTPTRPGLP
jgi:hypothetical protein